MLSAARRSLNRIQDVSEGYLGAETAEGLGEFESDITSAQNQEIFRDVIKESLGITPCGKRQSRREMREKDLLLHWRYTNS